VPALKTCSHLETLLLGRNESITSDGWQKFATILESPNILNLKELIVVSNNIDDEAVAAFASSLVNNQSLQTF